MLLPRWGSWGIYTPIPICYVWRLLLPSLTTKRFQLTPGARMPSRQWVSLLETKWDYNVLEWQLLRGNGLGTKSIHCHFWIVPIPRCKGSRRLVFPLVSCVPSEKSQILLLKNGSRATGKQLSFCCSVAYEWSTAGCDLHKNKPPEKVSPKKCQLS